VVIVGSDRCDSIAHPRQVSCVQQSFANNFFVPSAIAVTLPTVQESDVLRRERDRLEQLQARVTRRLKLLADEIADTGQILIGSQGQSVANPLLRLELTLRIELRRISSDLAACEQHLVRLEAARPRPSVVDELGRNPRRPRRRSSV
jgi:hypothetical protein